VLLIDLSERLGHAEKQHKSKKGANAKPLVECLVPL